MYPEFETWCPRVLSSCDTLSCSTSFRPHCILALGSETCKRSFSKDDSLQKIILCKTSFSAKDHSQDPAKDHSHDVPQVENFGHKLKSDQNFVLCPPFPFLFIIIIICKLILAPRVASNRNTSFKVKLCTQQQQTPKGRGCCS